MTLISLFTKRWTVLLPMRRASDAEIDTPPRTARASRAGCDQRESNAVRPGRDCEEAATTLAPDEAQATDGARSGPTTLLISGRAAGGEGRPRPATPPLRDRTLRRGRGDRSERTRTSRRSAPAASAADERATDRQDYNDTDRDALRLDDGAPPEALDTLAKSEADLACRYVDWVNVPPPPPPPPPPAVRRLTSGAPSSGWCGDGAGGRHTGRCTCADVRECAGAGLSRAVTHDSN